MILALEIGVPRAREACDPGRLGVVTPNPEDQFLRADQHLDHCAVTRDRLLRRLEFGEDRGIGRRPGRFAEPAIEHEITAQGTGAELRAVGSKCLGQHEQ